MHESGSIGASTAARPGSDPQMETPAIVTELFGTIHKAQAAPDQLLGTILIDTEEDFDWTKPTETTSHDTTHLTHIADLVPLLGAYDAIPCFLLTYPVLSAPRIVRLLERLAGQGRCSLGIQLHPWVTPPLEGNGGSLSSFAGNLEPDMEKRKLEILADTFRDRFAASPRIYRAGRYGFGRNSAALIESLGIDIDTSLAPRTSMTEQGGPDFSLYDYGPFWFGRKRRLLELPLCRSVVGWGGAPGQALYQRTQLERHGTGVIGSALARLRCAERITLSPEGNDAAAMRRLLAGLLRRGQAVLPLSFHSSSIWPGRNPYVRDRVCLRHFYDSLSATLAYMADDLKIRFVDALSLPDLLTAGDRT